MKTYLAGKMSGLSLNEMKETRNKFISMLNEVSEASGKSIEIINPTDYYTYRDRGLSNFEQEMKEFLLNHVKTSDFILVDANNINTSIGTSIELHVAHENHIPVIALDEERTYLYQVIHPWVHDCITRYYSSVDEIGDYIQKFYLN